MTNLRAADHGGRDPRGLPAARRVLILAALFGIATAPVLAQPGARDRVDHVASRVDTIRGVPKGTSIRWPSVVRLHVTIIVAANVFPTDGSVPTDDRPIVIARVPGDTLPPPAGRFAFAYPKLVAGSDGALDLFWSEFARQPGQPISWSGVPSSLWHAEFRRGRWSEPEEIIHGKWVVLREAGRIARTENGKFHIVIPAALNPGAMRLLHVAGSTGHWACDTIGSAITAYSSVAVLTGNRLLVAYAGIVLDHGDAITGVFASRSLDDGAHWETPQLIASSPSTDAEAHGVQLVTLPNDVELVWGVGRRGGVGLSEIGSARSTDSGATWGRARITPVSPDARAFTASGTACGATTALVTRFDGTRLRVDRLTWTSTDSVRTEPELPGEYMVFGPGLTSSDGGLAAALGTLASAGAPPAAIVEQLSICK